MGVQTIRGSLTDRRFDRVLRRLLRENRLASFATIDRRGRAYIHTAYFAIAPGWELVFYSYPDSTHARNLARSPTMAVSIFDSHQRWGAADRGVQLFGRAAEATGRGSTDAERVYARRFPGFRKWRAGTEGADGVLALRPYRFRPRRAKLFDEATLGAGIFVEVPIP